VPSDDAELLRLEAELEANDATKNGVRANKSGLPTDDLWAAMDRIGERDAERLAGPAK
jgi:hypothetical protein